MVKFKINNTDFEASDGSTILEVARNSGINIPTLCHNDGLPHYSSCMICMVKDNRSGGFIPSCSALIQEGMDIDVSGEEVITLRKKALELLLSEHRAECEAPCKVVCPAGYDIPGMNRLLAAKDFESAIKLSIEGIKSAGIKCTDCPGYCENACRRKKIDLPVSIRNLQLYIFQLVSKTEIIEELPEPQQNMLKSLKRYTSRIGKIEAAELKEWLKECRDNVIRFREISGNDSASGEAESCMHCDCRAAENCRLRELAEEFSIKDPKGKLINAPIVKKINIGSDLIFENAKCVKCGLCVRLCEKTNEEPSLCFIQRGFISIISEPLTEKFEDILKTKSKEVIEICPTGALSHYK
jgi:hypothetical protein